MGKEFSITPRDVPRVETKYRRIVTPLPHPDSVATLEKLDRAGIYQHATASVARIHARRRDVFRGVSNIRTVGCVTCK